MEGISEARNGKSRKSKVAIIILAALLALAVAGGIWFYFAKDGEINSQKSQLNSAKKDLANSKKELESVKNTLENAQKNSENSENSGNSASENIPSQTEFYSIDDWNVKFILPEILSVDGNFHVVSEISGDKLFLSTDKVVKIGGNCENLTNGFGNLVTISRSSTAPTNPKLHSLGKLGNYFYAAGKTQNTCSETAVETQIESQNALFSMSSTLMAK